MTLSTAAQVATPHSWCNTYLLLFDSTLTATEKAVDRDAKGDVLPYTYPLRGITHEFTGLLEDIDASL